MVLHHSLTELNLVICPYAWHLSFMWQISSLFGGLNTFLFIQLPTETTFYLLFSTIWPFDVTKRSQRKITYRTDCTFLAFSAPIHYSTRIIQRNHQGASNSAFPLLRWDLDRLFLSLQSPLWSHPFDSQWILTVHFLSIQPPPKSIPLNSGLYIFLALLIDPALFPIIDSTLLNHDVYRIPIWTGFSPLWCSL